MLDEMLDFVNGTLAVLFTRRFLADSQVSLTSPLDKEDLSADSELSEEDESSVVSGMTNFLNGDLGLIEDAMQQLSAQTKRAESAKEDEFAFDIRPAVSTQAINKLVCSLKLL